MPAGKKSSKMRNGSYVFSHTLLLHPNHVDLGLHSPSRHLSAASECTVLLRGDVEANCSFLYTVNSLYYLNSFLFMCFL